MSALIFERIGLQLNLSLGFRFRGNMLSVVLNARFYAGELRKLEMFDERI